MLQSKLFPKTLRETPKDADNISTALLTRGGYIYKMMAGVYAFEYLGWRVMQKIQEIIREEMNVIDGLEVFLTALQPAELWQKSGRWDKLKGDMYQFNNPGQGSEKDKGYETGLAMTHEEVIIALLGQQPLSYQDLPVKLYQFQTKFRYEPRAKSGLLRTRELLMKDLYSAHASEEDLKKYYEEVKEAYIKIFKRFKIPIVVTLASGGMFTLNFTHEFQSICEIGEDTIYACPEMDYAVNKEVIDKLRATCPTHKTKLEEHRAVEMGNIFNLGTRYSEDLGIFFTDEAGKEKPIWLASYGIGLGRLMGVIVEHHHDERGITWPNSVAPFVVHLLDITKTPEEKKRAHMIYQSITEAGIEVLFDDRETSAGTKFADADLLGMPIRLVVSSKTLEKESIEFKYRAARNIELAPISKLVEKIKNEVS